MKANEAIRKWCGVCILPPPEDGVLRTFKIDRLSNGFVVAIDGLWAFGSVIDGTTIIFDGEECWELSIEHKRSKKITYEWLVWEAGRVMIESGIVITQEDSERLALAVKRLESWL